MSQAVLNTTTTGNSTTSFAQRPITSILYQRNPDGTASSFVTLAANRFTLTAGVYRIAIRAKATGASGHNVGIRLYNVTDAAAVADTEDAQQVPVADRNVNLFIDTGFVLAGSKQFELQGKSSVAYTDGYGKDVTGFTDYYTLIKILKTA